MKNSDGTHPILLFVGDAFVNDFDMMQFKTFALDFFSHRPQTQVDSEALEHALVFTAIEGKILLRHYRLLLSKSGLPVRPFFVAFAFFNVGATSRPFLIG